MDICNSKEVIIKREEATGNGVRSQYIAATCASLSMFICGVHFGWVAPTLPILLSANSPIPITSAQSSTLSVLLQLGAIPGTIIGSLVCDHLGRRVALMSIAVPYFVSGMLLVFAADLNYLFASRFITGVAVGASFTTLPTYLSEISSPHIRGVLSSLCQVALNFGLLFVFAFAPFFAIRSTAIVITAFPVVFLMSAVWIPETPYYYIMKNQDQKAQAALVKLRADHDILDEYMNMKKTHESEDTRGLVDLFTVRSNVRALGIIMVLLSAQQFCGIAAISTYSQIIFEEAASIVSTPVSGILLASSLFFVSFASGLCMDRFGRRLLILTSAATTILPLALVGVFFYLKRVHFEHIQDISLLPLVGLILYKFTVSLGLGPVPYVVVGEIFPTAVRSKASCVVSILGSVFGFTVVKFHQIVTDAYGLHVVIACYMACCAFTGVCIYFVLPETKGKTLADIQHEMKSA